MIEKIEKLMRDTTGMLSLAQRLVIDLALFVLLVSALWRLIAS
jgi:hypothetical protein